MAVDDTVNGLSGSNAILTYQPAAGVEVVITSIMMDISIITPRLTDGAKQPIFSGGTRRVTDTRVRINNTNYLYNAAGGAGVFTGYTGIVTK